MGSLSAPRGSHAHHPKPVPATLMVEEERLVLIEHALWCHGDIGGSEWFIAATADASVPGAARSVRDFVCHCLPRRGSGDRPAQANVLTVAVWRRFGLGTQATFIFSGSGASIHSVTRAICCSSMSAGACPQF
jgi:hypothetical protein